MCSELEKDMAPAYRFEELSIKVMFFKSIY